MGSNSKTKRFRRSRREIRAECNQIYRYLMEGLDHNAIQKQTGLTPSTYWRYHKIVRQTHGAKFIEQADQKIAADEIALSTSLLEGRLSQLYQICSERLKNDRIANRDFAAVAAVQKEIATDLHLLKLQGTAAALAISRRYQKVEQLDDIVKVERPSFLHDGRFRRPALEDKF